MSDDKVAELLAKVGLTPSDLSPEMLDVARGHVADAAPSMNELIRAGRNRPRPTWTFPSTTDDQETSP